MVGPFDLVHERTHEKDAAAVGFEQVFRVRRVGNLSQIEAWAEVANEDLDALVRTLKRDLDLFLRVELVPVLHRVRDRFADRQVDGRRKIVAQTATLHKRFRLRGRFIDGLDLARQF